MKKKKLEKPQPRYLDLKPLFFTIRLAFLQN